MTDWEVYFGRTGAEPLPEVKGRLVGIFLSSGGHLSDREKEDSVEWLKAADIALRAYVEKKRRRLENELK